MYVEEIIFSLTSVYKMSEALYKGMHALQAKDAAKEHQLQLANTQTAVKTKAKSKTRHYKSVLI